MGLLLAVEAHGLSNSIYAGAEKSQSQWYHLLSQLARAEKYQMVDICGHDSLLSQMYLIFFGRKGCRV